MNRNEKIREILLQENANRIKQQSKPLHECPLKAMGPGPFSKFTRNCSFLVLLLAEGAA